MKVLSDEKIKALAERNGWSLAQAQGHIDGENYRRRGTPPSQYALVGIDGYSLGFRAAYFDRRNLARGDLAQPLSQMGSAARPGAQPLSQMGSAARPGAPSLRKTR